MSARPHTCAACARAGGPRPCRRWSAPRGRAAESTPSRRTTSSTGSPPRPAALSGYRTRGRAHTARRCRCPAHGTTQGGGRRCAVAAAASQSSRAARAAPRHCWPRAAAARGSGCRAACRRLRAK
eukprot:6669696-Prymnesium_polylepis.1